MLNVAFYDAHSYDRPAFERFGKEAGIRFHFYEVRLRADTATLAHGCEAVCIFVNDSADREVIEQLCRIGVRCIALRCAGYNNVDLSAAEGRLRVVRVPAYSPHAVAEHAMALLLCSVRRIHKAYIRTRDFNFSLHNLTGFELNGKTAGIVGTGKIGRAFLRICDGFGMQTIAYDPYPVPDSNIRYVSLEELYARSDVISFHCPLTPETYHMLSEDNIARLKPGVLLINTSRGALIDAEALLQGIKARHIGGACLDVYEEEADLFFRDLSNHIMNDDVLARLISMPNVIVSSHQGFLTREALDQIAETSVHNLLACAEGQPCENELFSEQRKQR